MFQDDVSCNVVSRKNKYCMAGSWLVHVWVALHAFSSYLLLPAHYPRAASPSPLPPQEAERRTPVPADSPLLSKVCPKWENIIAKTTFIHISKQDAFSCTLLSFETLTFKSILICQSGSVFLLFHAFPPPQFRISSWPESGPYFNAKKDLRGEVQNLTELEMYDLVRIKATFSCLLY